MFHCRLIHQEIWHKHLMSVDLTHKQFGLQFKGYTNACLLTAGKRLGSVEGCPISITHVFICGCHYMQG